MATVIGIDPGTNGAIAVLSDDYGPRTYQPVTERDYFDVLSMIFREDNEAVAYCEKVHAGPKIGSSAAFKYGQCVGAMRMACIAANLRVYYVTPQEWQKRIGLRSVGGGFGNKDTEKKNRNKALAQELFPRLKITHAIADALLICEYGRRVTSGRVVA